MPRELAVYAQNCFEQNDPRALVIQKNRDMKDKTLKKQHDRVVQRPKTPPLEQADMFEGISKKSKKKTRRKSKKPTGYYYQGRRK